MQRNGLFSTTSNAELQKTLSSIELIIDSNDNKNFDRLSKGLIKYSLDLLQKFYQASTKFKDFCQKNVQFQDAMADNLRGRGFINVAITSMNGKEHISLFEIFIAAGTLGQFYTNMTKARASKDEEAKEMRLHCMQALSAACELGLYNALLARCDLNTTRLSSTTVSDAEKEEAIKSILADVKRLSNLYWLMGYVAAGWILHDVSDYFAKIPEKKNRAISFREESIKNFLCASRLEENPDSKKIEHSMTGGKEYLEDMEIKDGDKILRTWSDAKMTLNTWSGNRETYEKLRNTAKIEIDSILKPSAAEIKTTPKIG